MMRSPAVRCPVSRALKVLGGKWKPLIVYHLEAGVCRNGELRRVMPEITQKVLTQQLRELEDDGMVKREVHPVVPPRVDYTLTEFGKSARPVLDAMAEWGATCDSEFPAVEEKA